MRPGRTAGGAMASRTERWEVEAATSSAGLLAAA